MKFSRHQRHGQTASAAQHKPNQNTTTPSQIESLSRLRYTGTTLINQAEQFVIYMKGRLPESGIEFGIWHQLPGKMCNGVLCSSIIVSEVNATYIDLYNGIVVTVDQFGRREPSLIGSAG